jgi:hypothetical protein
MAGAFHGVRLQRNAQSQLRKIASAPRQWRDRATVLPEEC